MVNPYPFQNSRLMLTEMTKTDDTEEQQQESKPKVTARRTNSVPRAIVFDTMIVYDTMDDDTPQSPKGDSSPLRNIRKQQTINNHNQIQDEPKQFFIHSQQKQTPTSPSSSLVKSLSSFFASARNMETDADNDAFFWWM